MTAATRDSRTQLRQPHGTPVAGNDGGDSVVSGGGRAGNSPRTKSYRQMAINALSQMFEQAESDQVHGVIGVEVGFQNGQASYVRKQTNLTER